MYPLTAKRQLNPYRTMELKNINSNSWYIKKKSHILNFTDQRDIYIYLRASVQNFVKLKRQLILMMMKVTKFVFIFAEYTSNCHKWKNYLRDKSSVQGLNSSLLKLTNWYVQYV